MDDRTFKRRCLYVAVTILGLFAAIGVLWNIMDILGVCAAALGKIFYYISPLIYAFCIAYILYIPVSYLEINLRKNAKIAAVKPKRLRVGTMLTAYIALIALAVVIMASIYIMIGGQISDNLDFKHVFDYIINYFAGFEFGSLNMSENESLAELLSTIESWVQKIVTSNLKSLSSTVTSIGSIVVMGVVSLIISIYFILDYEELTKRMNDVYMGSFGKTSPGRKIYNVVNVFSKTFKQFLKGQLLEAFIVAVLSVIALRIVGVNYYGVIGIISGICNLIPFVGPWIGAVVAVIVSLLGGGFMTAIWSVVAMIIVQQIDNHLLAPKIVGDSVGLHPVITMVVLLVGADIGGILGMLLAVPVAATVKNLLSGRNSRRAAEAGAVIIDGNDAASAAAADGAETPQS